MNKKGNAGVIFLSIVMILFGVVEFFAHPEVFMPEECKGSEQCTSNQYCGSDFKCHEVPAREVVNNYNDFTRAGIAIAIAIVIAAIILRYNKGWHEKFKQLSKKDEEQEHNSGNEEPKYLRVG